jgi:hypothetical protein
MQSVKNIALPTGSATVPMRFSQSRKECKFRFFYLKKVPPYSVSQIPFPKHRIALSRAACQENICFSSRFLQLVFGCKPPFFIS